MSVRLFRCLSCHFSQQFGDKRGKGLKLVLEIGILEEQNEPKSRGFRGPAPTPMTGSLHHPHTPSCNLLATLAFKAGNLIEIRYFDPCLVP